MLLLNSKHSSVRHPHITVMTVLCSKKVISNNCCIRLRSSKLVAPTVELLDTK